MTDEDMFEDYRNTGLFKPDSLRDVHLKGAKNRRVEAPACFGTTGMSVQSIRRWH
jgi:hypothetical protein